MKKLLILTVGICLLFPSVPVMADQAVDEAAVRKAVQKLLATFNSHDVKALLPLVDENSVPWEGGEKGKAAIEKRMTEDFSSQRDMKVKVTQEIGVVSVTPNVAIYKANVEFTGIVNDEGKSQPAMRYLGAWVMVKKGGRWLSVAFFSRPIEE